MKASHRTNAVNPLHHVTVNSAIGDDGSTVSRQRSPENDTSIDCADGSLPIAIFRPEFWGAAQKFTDKPAEPPMTALCRAVLTALALLTLSACVPNNWPAGDWSGYISKTETLRFLAAADCNIPYLFNPITKDATFLQVTDLRPVQGRPWSYDVSYITDDGARRDRFDVVQSWAAAGTRTSTQYGERHQCAVLADVPKSKNAERPYFYTDNEQAKTAEHASLVFTETLVSCILAALFIVVLIPSFFGFEDSRGENLPAEAKWLLALMAAFGVIGVSLIVSDMYLSEPWHTFEKARQYYTWYRELPRSQSGFLMPLSAQQFYFLLAGPPHPAEMQVAIDPYLWVTALLAEIWLLVMMPAFVKGLYWICKPLPLEKAHRRALREGRTLSAEEILAAMNKAVVGKRAWQLNIMRRKAEAFAQRFGYVANSQS